MPGGPRFVSINPAVSVPDVTSSPQPGASVGSFSIHIHVIPYPPVIELGPPRDFIEDMAVTVKYRAEMETDFTPERQAVVLAWVTKINRKYPRLAEAARTGGPILFVDGFASITGTPLENQNYANNRLTPVKQFIARQLAVPPDKISPKPYGSQQAAWHYEFDTKGGAAKGPRAEDRRVVAWFDADAAWKVVKGSK
jgi:hypothetical protein